MIAAAGKPMRTKVLTLASAAVLCVLAVGGSSAAASGNAASVSRVKLQAALDGIVAAGVPGALVLVRDGDQTIRLASGYGNLARRTPMRVTDRFRVGSDTKTFVATVVLQLVGERKLALDDTVERRLPGIVPNGRKITVRQLLNHTSGLYDYAEDKVFLAQLDHPNKVWSPSALVKIATKHQPVFRPGRRWSYSNTGYILLGLMVEEATGNKLGRELRERIFEPLGLRGTTFDTKPRIAGRHVHGYTKGRGRVRYDISVVNPSLFGAAGAIRERPCALPPRARPRPPAPPRPAGGHADDGPRHAATAVRPRRDPHPLSVRDVLGPRGRDVRLPDLHRHESRRKASGRDRDERRRDRALRTRGRRGPAPECDRSLRLRRFCD